MDELKKRIKEAGLEWVSETDETIVLQSLSGFFSDDLIDEVEFSTGKQVKRLHVKVKLDTNLTFENLPFVSNIEDVFQSGLKFNASDIHIEKYLTQSVIRYRVDGLLVPVFAIRLSEYQSIINKVKIKADLDISEKRLPQDGRIQLELNNEFVELRVSIIPAIYGEKIVLRFLRSDLSHLSLKSVGLNTIQKDFLEKKLTNPSGLILVSGPTGSGKTTTLYGILKHLNLNSRNILTIEDPIEYSLPGINQVHLKEEIGLTYPNALRAFLRQDPDIIMIGEIRDFDTAQMAIRASLTGHLVLSTIHANSTLGVVNRLVDIGIPFYQVKSALRMAVSQRLIRTFCKKCQGKGCEDCYSTGFKGRKALFEMIDTKQLEKYNNTEDLSMDKISVIGGSMIFQLNEILESKLTSRAEVQPFFEEFEN